MISFVFVGLPSQSPSRPLTFIYVRASRTNNRHRLDRHDRSPTISSLLYGRGPW